MPYRAREPVRGPYIIRSVQAPVGAPYDCLRALYGPKLVGSPCLKVVYSKKMSND